MFDWLRPMLTENQVFSGGAVLMAAAAIGAYLRNIPSKLFNYLRSIFVYSVTIDERDDLYDGCIRWLANHEYTKKRARSFFATSKAESNYINSPYSDWDDNYSPGEESTPVITLTPADGSHFFFYMNTIVWISRHTDRNQNRENQQASTIAIYVLGYNRAIAMQLLEEIGKSTWPKDEETIPFYKCNFYHDGEVAWKIFSRCQKRPQNSVILKGGDFEGLLGDLHNFRNRHTWYRKRFVPYHRGYLLYGPPGTGKTSTIVAVATELKMAIVFLQLSDSAMDDSKLMNAMNSLPKNSIVMLEDIDCLFDVDRQQKTVKLGGGVTFSGLLNALDGVTASDGRIIFSTTNHLERINSALLRSGRFDVKLRVDHPDCDQVIRMICRFFPEHKDDTRIPGTAYAIAEKRVSVAAVQEYLLSRIEDFDSVIDEHSMLTEQEPGRLVHAWGTAEKTEKKDEE